MKIDTVSKCFGFYCNFTYTMNRCTSAFSSERIFNLHLKTEPCWHLARIFELIPKIRVLNWPKIEKDVYFGKIFVTILDCNVKVSRLSNSAKLLSRGRTSEACVTFFDESNLFFILLLFF